MPPKKGASTAKLAHRTTVPHGPQIVHPPTTEIVVNQVRSFELVRIVVTASISNITFLRSVFPDNCYDMRVLESSDPDSSYDSFIRGDSHWSREQGNYAWMILSKGVNKSVDKLLHWLETSVAEALQKKFLASLQLSFFEGNDGTDIIPKNLVEAYTLSFSYADGHVSVRLTSKSCTGASFGDNDTTLFDAKEGIRRAIDINIVNAQSWCRDLPELPKSRVASMLLTYTDSCPEGWNPEGFVALSDSKLIVTAESQSVQTKEVITGHHSMQISLYNKFAEQPVHPSKSVVGSTTSQSELSKSSQIDGGATQESGVKAFRSIGTSRDPQAQTQDTQPIQSSTAVHDTTMTVSNSCVPYTQAVKQRIEEAHRRRELAAVDSPTDPGLDELQARDAHIVSCECGSSTDDGDLKLQCEVCFNFQHSQCYGFLDICPPNSDDRICYTCLLGRYEKTLLSEMKLLCLKRRALHFLRTQGTVKDQNDFASLAEFLNRKEVNVTNVLHELQKDGIVDKKRPRGSKKGKSKAGFATFTLVDDEVKLHRDFFHPRQKLEHHFAIPKSAFSEDTNAPKSYEKELCEPIPSRTDESQGGHPERIISSAATPSRLEGSSTQGTPSTRASTRGMKRRADEELKQDSARKRVQAGITRSPLTTNL